MSDEQYTAHVPTDTTPEEELFLRKLELTAEGLAKERLANRIVQHPRYRS